MRKQALPLRLLLALLTLSAGGGTFYKTHYQKLTGSANLILILITNFAFGGFQNEFRPRSAHH